ncbi:MAG: hypothetical protein U0939_02445 [Pirellulales bacterium]
MSANHSSGHDHDAHEQAADAVFKSSFDADVQQELLQEDSEAWYNVTGELLTIVTCGVAFFIFIVWLITRS